MITPIKTICLSGVMALGFVFSNNALAITSASLQQSQTEKVLSDSSQDGASASATAQTQTTMDRSGFDRASVHLQILQQTSQQFGESGTKKSAPFDKKTPIKNSSAP